MNRRTTARDDDLKCVRTLSWLFQKNAVHDSGVEFGKSEEAKEQEEPEEISPLNEEENEQED
jgi:hypothetical protein